jgi:predicted N-acyltransferase
MLHTWPLLICRSPLSYTSGVVLPQDSAVRKDVIALLLETALEQGHQKKCSFLLFDYLSKEEKADWSADLWIMEMPGPGTVLRNMWQDFDDYLAHGNKKDRQHYKRTAREAEKLKIKIKRSSRVEVKDEILTLIRNVESKHGAPYNPWTVSMLQNMDMVQGTFLTATIDEKVVGCGLLIEDNGAQLASALGLSGDIPYVYLLLVYEGIKVALEHKLNLLRWGSGAYDVKQRLGFIHEDNSLSAFTPIHPLVRKLTGLPARPNRRSAS